MADETVPIEASPQDSTGETAAPGTPSQDSRRETMAYVIGVAGWLVPGLGHALMKFFQESLPNERANRVIRCCTPHRASLLLS